MSENLSDFLDRDKLRELAWGMSHERGVDYFKAGRVRDLKSSDRQAVAQVLGSRPYRARLWVELEGLRHACSCPLGDDGIFCKHVVATGLAWLAAAANGLPSDPTPDIRSYLEGLGKSDLVEILLDQADRDERLRRDFALRAARNPVSAPDLAVWRGAIDDAVGVHDYIDYRAMYDYSTGVEDVVESIADLLTDGHAQAAMSLSEHGIQAIEEAVEYIDDSDGITTVLLDRLQEIHFEACRQAGPDPVDLAERLYELAMDSDFGAFRSAVETYRELLGDAGVSAFRKLAEADWAKVPPLGPGEDDPSRYGGRYTLTSIMMDLAKASGDIEQRVAVKSRDLSSPYAFLEIAEIYRDAGMATPALAWARRGWEAFKGHRRDHRLREFIAGMHHEEGRHEMAMALVWEAFSEAPSFVTYQGLERHGKRVNDWPNWQGQAQALIRREIEARRASKPEPAAGWNVGSFDGSLLVQVLLHENRDDAAWSAALAHGCVESLWLALAKRRESGHPRDAVEIYRRKVASLLRGTGNAIYEEATDYLQGIARLRASTEDEAAFQALITDIRTTHKRKRNLMKLLDHQDW